MKQRISDGKVDINQFNDAEKSAINNGKAKIGDYKWHHGVDTGHMQLIRSNVHNNETGFSHWGWFSQGS